MHITRESVGKQTIQAYSESEVKINEVIYTESVLVTADEVFPNWPLKHLNDLALDAFSQVLASSPEIILIGHAESGGSVPMGLRQALLQQRIGFECMSLGAACRTFNVLLSEGRSVVLGLLFKPLDAPPAR